MQIPKSDWSFGNSIFLEMQTAHYWGIVPPLKFYEYDEMNRAVMVATYITQNEIAAWDAHQRAEEQRMASERASRAH